MLGTAPNPPLKYAAEVFVVLKEVEDAGMNVSHGQLSVRWKEFGGGSKQAKRQMTGFCLSADEIMFLECSETETVRQPCQYFPFDYDPRVENMHGFGHGPAALIRACGKLSQDAKIGSLLTERRGFL